MDFTALELSPDETSRQRVLDAINDNAVLCGADWSGSVLTPSRRLLFVAKDEASVKAIEAALKRRASEARVEPGVARQQRPEQKEFDKAMRSAGSRAAKSATFELQGRRLTVTLAVAPNEAETRAMSKLLELRKANAQRAAEVVRGLSEGKLPTAQQLEGFLASSPADAAAGPK
jgi:hypothetical protein